MAFGFIMVDVGYVGILIPFIIILLHIGVYEKSNTVFTIERIKAKAASPLITNRGRIPRFIIFLQARDYSKVRAEFRALAIRDANDEMTTSFSLSVTKKLLPFSRMSVSLSLISVMLAFSRAS